MTQASENDWTPIYGIPEPDWHLMDPVTGGDLAAYQQLNERAAQEQLEHDREGFGGRTPWEGRERYCGRSEGRER
jgi:hypothetical protein